LYAPFGEITNEYNSGFGNNVLPKYSFNAKELDEETGMYYYEARYMAPPVFISRDPLFEKYPTFSPYAYCANNPIKYIDPTGETIVVCSKNGQNETKYYWDNGKVWTPYGKNGRKPVEGAEYIRDNDVGKIIKSLNKINSTKEGKYILSKLSASSNEYKIRNEQKGDSYACYVRSEKTVYMNKNNGIGVLSHELFHAFQDLNGRGEASIYNEVEAYVFQGMVSTSLEVDDYNSGMKAPKDFPDEELANKYINAMKNLVTNFNYKDFKIAIKNFKKVSKANNIRGKYNNYRLIPNRHVLTTGSLLKKVR
jgi:RHS repeat-associated protein